MFPVGAVVVVNSLEIVFELQYPCSGYQQVFLPLFSPAHFSDI